MSTVQWRPAVNALTVPPSYKILFVPRNSIGYPELAAELAAEGTTLTAETIEAVLRAERRAIKRHLINGNQITLEDDINYRLSFRGKLAAPDDPLPDRDDLIQVSIYASAALMRDIRHEIELERRAAIQKQPLIGAAEDTRTKLNDVLNPNGVLKLTGTNLFFNEHDADCNCVIAGTRSGQTVQNQFALISNSEVLIVPDIPLQETQWNNEYTVSITTKYTQHGLLRTGTYERKLRSPLLIDGFSEGGLGILTGSAAAPYVRASGGSVSGDETLRIQAILDIHAGQLRFNLLDMTEGGKAGPVVTVTVNGVYTLQGFADSAVSSIEISVDNYAELVTMARNVYMSRVVDVLEIRLT